MAVVYMTYPVHKDKESSFREAYASILQAMQAAPGHQQTDLFKSVSDTGVFVIISEWDGTGAFDTFVNSEQFRSATSSWGASGIVAGQPRHHIVES